MPNLLTPLPFLDASGQPANGFIFAQATRTFSTADGFITTARSMGRVVNGVFLTADDSKSDPFVLVTATADAPLSIVIKLDSYTTDGRLVKDGGGVASRTVTVPDVGTVTWLDLVDVVAVADAVPYVIQPWMQDAMDNAAAASASAATATTKAGEAAASAASIVRGAANGVAPLDGSSKVPDANLPTRLGASELSTTIDGKVKAADGMGAASALARGKRLMSSVIGTRSETLPDVTLGTLAEYRTAGGASVGGTVSFTAATDIITTSLPHGLAVGDPVEFGTMSASNGLTAGNASYWVVDVATSVTFKVSTTRGGIARDITADSTSVGLWRREWAYVRADSRVNPGLRGIEAPLVQGVNSSPNYDYIRTDPAATTYAPGTAVGPHPAVMTLYRGKRLDVLIRHDTGARFVIYVDGIEVARVASADLTAAGVAAGSLARLPLTFSAARDRIVKVVGDRSFSYIAGFNLEAGQSLYFPASMPKGARTIVAGDSFIEGEGAVAEPTIVNWLSWALGWTDVWNSGSGSTGYVSAGTRTSLVNRHVNDIINRAPDRVVIGMGYNDQAEALGSVVTAAETIWDAILAANAYIDLIVIGPWPSSGGTVTATAELIAIDTALAASAKTRGVQYISPISDGLSFTRADATHPDPAGHQKVGMYLAGRVAGLAVVAAPV